MKGCRVITIRGPHRVKNLLRWGYKRNELERMEMVSRVRGRRVGLGKDFIIADDRVSSVTIKRK